MTYNINYNFINIEVSGLDSIFRYDSYKFITSPMVQKVIGLQNLGPLRWWSYEHKINYPRGYV